MELGKQLPGGRKTRIQGYEGKYGCLGKEPVSLSGKWHKIGKDGHWGKDRNALPWVLTSSKAKSRKFYLSNPHSQGHLQEISLFCRWRCLLQRQLYAKHVLFRSSYSDQCPILQMSHQKELFLWGILGKVLSLRLLVNTLNVPKVSIS